jgi:hypothetical protein
MYGRCGLSSRAPALQVCFYSKVLSSNPSPIPQKALGMLHGLLCGPLLLEGQLIFFLFCGTVS